MDSIFKFLSQSSPIVSIMATVLVTLAFSLKIFLQYKKEIKKAEVEQDKYRTKLAPKSLDNLSELLVQNFKVLNSFYSENLSQYRTSALASISISVLGFIVILAGILIAIIGKEIALGAISSSAGIISEAAAVLFFKQNRVFQEQMESSLRKLISSQYLMTSIALARELEGKDKGAEFSLINNHLRHLMDSLHQEKEATTDNKSRQASRRKKAMLEILDSAEQREAPQIPIQLPDRRKQN